MSATSTGGPLGDRILDIIQVQYGDRRSPAKALARDGKVSAKSGSNWLRRICSPRANELLELMTANEELAAEVNAAIEEKRRCRHSSSK